MLLYFVNKWIDTEFSCSHLVFMGKTYNLMLSLMAYRLKQLQFEPVCEHILAQKNERMHLQRMKILLAGISGISGRKDCGEYLILRLKSCQLES